MKKYVMSLDQGTTSTRFIIFDHMGQIVSIDQKEHGQIYPKSGWVEHNSLEIWSRVCEVALGALEKGKIDPQEVSAIGITNQRETTVIWDKKSGRPIYNAIVWNDTRTDKICDELAKEGGQGRLRAKTGLPLATYFSGPKIKWILDNVEGARAAAEKGELLFGTMDTWVVWNLTGEHITDVTNASRTLLMNLNTLDWDADILKLFGIPREMLPKICSSSEIYGEINTPELKHLHGIPVSGILGDQQAALFGQTCFNPGEAKNTYGTGCFMLMNMGELPVPSTNGLLTTLAYQLENQKAVYALEGSIAMAGSLVQWFRDNLGLIEKSGDIETLAASVDDSGGVYFVPAFSGLFAPYWRSDARGVLVGLTHFINKGHIARSVLEATCYQTREILEAMEKDSGVQLKSLKVDGGMVVDELLMQFQSDILNVPVTRPKVTETTALGAAYAAGLATGFWKNFDELRVNWGKDKEWQPKMDTECREKIFAGWKRAVTKTFDLAT
jgi:glycerol kinase